MKKFSTEYKEAVKYLKKHRVGNRYRGDLVKLVEAFNTIESVSKNHPLLK